MIQLSESIQINGLQINPFAPEAAKFVLDAYDWWARPGERKSWKPPDGWDAEPVEWEGVQVILGSREVREDDPILRLAGPVLLPPRAGTRLRVAVIPGTNEVRDWFEDASFWPMRIGGLPGRWRRGFALGGEWIWSQLEHFAGDRDALAIWGHSYGASMTLTAAAHAMRDGEADRIVSALGFAATRVTSGKGAAALDAAFDPFVAQRYVLGFDVVPWAVLPLGWHHAFEAVYIGSDGVTRPRHRFFPELWRALRLKGVQAIGDHGMRNYEAWASELPAPAPSSAKVS